MKIKFSFLVPTEIDPNIEQVTVIEHVETEPSPKDLQDWALKVWDYRQFEYPTHIRLTVEDQPRFVPLYLMKYVHEWAADPFSDDGDDGLGMGSDFFYVLKPFVPFVPSDHSYIEDDWTDSKGEHTIRTDYRMDNAGVLYTPDKQFELRYIVVNLHKGLKGNIYRKY